MAVNMYEHMSKVVIKILQGSAVTVTMLGELTIHPPVANFLQCTYAKNYENWLAVSKLLQKLSGLLFLAHPVCYMLPAAFLPHTCYRFFLFHRVNKWNRI